MGLSNLPLDIQNIVKRAVVEGEVQAEHKVNNLMGSPILTGVHKRRADADAPAAANEHENEHKTKKTAGAARNESALAGLPPSPGNDRFGRQLRRGGRGGRRSNRGRGGAKFLCGKATSFAGLTVCHVCQSNSPAHKDCPRTCTNKSVADLEAFAPGLLPQLAARDLRNGREAEPSDSNEVGPEYRASMLVPAQPMSLFDLPSDYRMQGEIRNRGAVVSRNFSMPNLFICYGLTIRYNQEQLIRLLGAVSR